MPQAERSFELEVNRAKTIVRVHCIKDPPENAPVFVGKRLESVLKWNSQPSGGLVDATLAGRGPCQFAVRREGEHVVFSVHWACTDCLPEFRGSIAVYQRAVDMVEEWKGGAKTLLVGTYDYTGGSAMEEPPTNAALRLLLRNLDEPDAIVAYKSSDLFAAMPKVPAQDLELRLDMFFADCRVEFADRHRWAFGAKTLNAPIRMVTAYDACRVLAPTEHLFAQDNMREAS